MSNDGNYYERRAPEERAAASSAFDPRVRKIHALMADCYRAKAQALADSKAPVLH